MEAVKAKLLEWREKCYYITGWGKAAFHPDEMRGALAQDMGSALSVVHGKEKWAALVTIDCLEGKGQEEESKSTTPSLLPQLKAVGAHVIVVATEDQRGLASAETS